MSGRGPGRPSQIAKHGVRDRVIELHEEGLGPTAIARRVSEECGGRITENAVRYFFDKRKAAEVQKAGEDKRLETMSSHKAEVVSSRQIPTDADLERRCMEELWISVKRLLVIEQESEKDHVRAKCHEVRAEILFEMLERASEQQVTREILQRVQAAA